MCARIYYAGKEYKVGDKLPVLTAEGTRQATFQGFARSETLAMWSAWSPAAIPAEAFAERNHVTGALVQAKLSPGRGIQALTHADRVVVITQAATPKQAAYFGHDRVPVTNAL